MKQFEEHRLLYLDEACAVVNKLPGEAVEGAGPGMTDLPKLLAGHLGEKTVPAAVHRLDVPVSGCVLFARTPTALACLNGAFAAGLVEKRYWAVLELPPPQAEIPETGELVHWLETDRRQNKSAAWDEEKPGRKKARLRYRILGRGTNYMFWELEPLTGRRHQIRAQLAALGLHIKGDLKYGARRSEKGGGIRLHGRYLAFPNPLNRGEILRINAPPPVEDNLWQAFLSISGAGNGERPAGDPPSGGQHGLLPENAGKGQGHGP